MTGTDDDSTPTYSRRAVLAAGGTGLACGVAAGGLGGLLPSVGGAAARSCDPEPLSTSPSDWITPGQDTANTGHAPARSGPDTLDRRWLVETERREYASPLVVDGAVITPTVAGEGNDAHAALAGYDLGSGDRRWRAGDPDSPQSPRSAVAAGGFVYEVNRTTPVARYVTTGEERWRLGDVTARHPPVVADGLARVVERLEEDRATLHAVDARTGERCRRRTYGFSVDGRPAVTDDALVYPGDGGFVAFDRATDEVRWRQPFEDGFPSTPRVADGRVFASIFDGLLVALDETSGEELWRVESEHYVAGGTGDEGETYALPTFEFGAVTPNAVVVREEVYSDVSDRIRAYDPETGDPLWDREAAEETNYAFSPPAVAGQSVYTVEANWREDSFRLLELNLETGERLRDHQLDVEGFEVVVADGTVVVVSRNAVSAFGTPSA